MTASAAPSVLVRYGQPDGRWVLLATVLGSALAFVDATVGDRALAVRKVPDCLGGLGRHVDRAPRPRGLGVAVRTGVVVAAGVLPCRGASRGCAARRDQHGVRARCSVTEPRRPAINGACPQNSGPGLALLILPASWSKDFPQAGLRLNP